MCLQKEQLMSALLELVDGEGGGGRCASRAEGETS